MIPNDVNVLPVPGGPLIKDIYIFNLIFECYKFIYIAGILNGFNLNFIEL